MNVRSGLAVLALAAAGPEVARFVDLAPSAGLTAPTVIGAERTKQYILETTGGGAAILDYDDDGWPDIFLVNGSRLDGEAAPSRLYRNRGDGTFADVTDRSGLHRRGWGQGVCAGDYDNDGRVDLFVTYYGQSVLYRNQGGGVFGDATRPAGLATPDRYSTGCAFLDYDRDGRLDLFVSAYLAYEDAVRYPPGTAGQNCSWKGLVVMCGPAGLRGAPNVLYQGNADGTFTDVSERAGILKAAPSFGFTPLVLDYDNDGWPDVYVANDSRAALLFHNEKDGTFKERGLMAGAVLTADGRAQAGMGVAAADYDGDGWLDIAKTNFDDDTTSLYRNLGDGGFEESSVRAGLGANTRYLGWGVGFLDFDLDGWPDLLTVNGHVYPEADRAGARYAYAQPKVLYRNLGDGRFEDVSPNAGSAIALRKVARGAAFGDLFNGGRVDVVVNDMNDVPTLLHDCAPRKGQALVVKLEGTRSNRSAIGARVVVHVGPRRLIDEVRSGGSFCSQNDLRLHFGLGTSAKADRVEVEWPSGARDVVSGVAAGQVVTIREGAGPVGTRAFAATRPLACS
ncbi:MAG TPA: CRTAC1 family protein [Vicinamibacteria bacterium]